MTAMKTEAFCPASRAIEYIETQLSTPLDLQQVAAAAGYSKYHLHRLFSRETGITPCQYIRRRKLTEAARLLVFSEQPIIDIALAAGYESRQAFTGVFKAMYKKTPGQYRREGFFYPLQLNCGPEGLLSGAQELSGILEREKEDKLPGASGAWKGKSDSFRIRPARDAAILKWMRLVRLVIDGYPCLQETQYRETLRQTIRQGCAWILDMQGEVSGIMALDEKRGWIDFLGVHPRLRERGIEEALLGEAFGRLAAGDSLTMTTFREGDKADTGYRRLLEKLGFRAAETLVEFGYPTQKMILTKERFQVAASRNEEHGKRVSRKAGCEAEHQECGVRGGSCEE